MDGVRAYWNGQTLLSRQNKVIEAPEDFINSLPRNITLDGELWMGRGTYEQLISILTSKNGDWTGVQYWVFDLPSSNQSFMERMVQLELIDLPPIVSDKQEQLT